MMKVRFAFICPAEPISSLAATDVSQLFTHPLPAERHVIVMVEPLGTVTVPFGTALLTLTTRLTALSGTGGLAEKALTAPAEASNKTLRKIFKKFTIATELN